MAYAIAYDLKAAPIEEYESLYAAIRAYGTFAHVLNSLWFIQTTENAVTIRGELLQHLKSSDRLIVFGITGESAWNDLVPKVSDWLKTNFN